MRSKTLPMLLTMVAMIALPLLACGKRATDPPSPRSGCKKSDDPMDTAPPPNPLPEYLQRLATKSDLYVRRDKELISAPPGDLAVLRSYPTSRGRGALIDGRRVTLLTAKTTAAIGEEVRVIHVVEVERPNEELWVMGPKPIVGEYVDGKLVTDPIPEWGPFTMGIYDGAVLKSPGVDTNYDITTYTFKEPGAHTIQWRAGKHESNVLCIDVR